MNYYINKLMRGEDIDLKNIYELWKYLTQSTVERIPDETDEHYKERILKYMENEK